MYYLLLVFYVGPISGYIVLQINSLFNDIHVFVTIDLV